MERIKVKATKGYILTQLAKKPIEERIYANRVCTSNPQDWQEVPISEYEEWKKEMEKLNTLNNEKYEKDCRFF